MGTDSLPASALLCRADNVNSLQGGSLVFRVDDLDTAIGFRQRIGGILQLGLAIADRHEVGGGMAGLLDQVSLDRVGPALRKFLVIGVAAGCIGMARDDKGRS